MAFKYFVAEELTFNLYIFGDEKWKGEMRGSWRNSQSQIRKIFFKIKLLAMTENSLNK